MKYFQMHIKLRFSNKYFTIGGNLPVMFTTQVFQIYVGTIVRFVLNTATKFLIYSNTLTLEGYNKG